MESSCFIRDHKLSKSSISVDISGHSNSSFSQRTVVNFPIEVIIDRLENADDSYAKQSLCFITQTNPGKVKKFKKRKDSYFLCFQGLSKAKFSKATGFNSSINVSIGAFCVKNE